MIIALTIRLEEFPDMDPRIVGTQGTPSECVAWMRGFLVGGVIVDKMTTIGS